MGNMAIGTIFEMVVCTYLRVRHTRDLVKVILSASGDFLEHKLFCYTTTKSHAHTIVELLDVRVKVVGGNRRVPLPGSSGIDLGAHTEHILELLDLEAR